MICPMCDSVSLDFRTRHKKTILYTENSVGDTLPHIRNNPRLGRKKKKLVSTHSGPHSRFGHKLLGIRVTYMFMYSALLKGVAGVPYYSCTPGYAPVMYTCGGGITTKIWQCSKGRTKRSVEFPIIYRSTRRGVKMWSVVVYTRRASPRWADARLGSAQARKLPSM